MPEKRECDICGEPVEEKQAKVVTSLFIAGSPTGHVLAVNHATCEGITYE